MTTSPCRRLAAAFAVFAYWLDHLADARGEPPIAHTTPDGASTPLDPDTLDAAMRFAVAIARHVSPSEDPP